LTLEQIAERLHARPSRGGWLARCPAHQDHSPSLSIREGNDGRVPKPRIVRDAEKQIADLRSRLTPRERVLPVTVVYVDPENLNAGLARALALAVVKQEIVQVVLER
jgi:hypothetical protein